MQKKTQQGIQLHLSNYEKVEKQANYPAFSTPRLSFHLPANTTSLNHSDLPYP